MWGIKFRFSGSQVETSVPGWLLNAAATYEAISLVQRAVAELARVPEAYGYDPANAHTLFFQTWDKALTGVQSVAFGRDAVGHGSVGLVPDVYYLQGQGYRGLRDAASALPRWEARAETLVWRGSVTGNGAFASPADIPRVRLASLARTLPDADVALTGVHPTMESVFSPAAIDDYLEQAELGGDFWPMARFGRYRYAIDIDGHANAWGLLEKLILGCCVLKVATPFEQWFYPRLRSWVHYVPVKADLSDLGERIAWCRANDDRCAWIAHNGAVLAASLTIEAELPRICATILAASYAEPITAKRARRAEPQAPALPEAALMEEARRWESLGRLDRAIEIYARLSEAGLGGPDALLRKSMLHRERGELVLAMQALDRAAAIAPYFHEPKLRLAQILTSLGRDLAAAAQVRQALREAPWLEELRINVADLCCRLDWLDVGYWAIRDLPEGLPDWWARARHYALTRFAERRAATVALLRARERGRPLDHGECWNLATHLAPLGRLNMAQRLCERVSAGSPDVFAPHELISKIISRREGPAATLAYLHGLPDHFGPEGDFAIRAGRSLLDLGRYDEVLAQVSGRPAIADTFDVRFMTAAALLSLDRGEALRDHCQGWMAAAPDDVLPAGILCTAQPMRTEEEADAPASYEGLSVVQFWDKPAVPADVAEVMASWSDQHPGLRCEVFHEAMAHDYLRDAFGAETARAFELCHHAAMKADVFRIAVLYREGGVWIDADEHCIRPMGTLMAAAAGSAITAVRSGDTLGYLHNYFLAARAGARPLEIALEIVTHDIHEAHRSGQHLSIWEATGPGLVTRAVGRYLVECEGDADVILMPIQQYRSFARTRGDLAYKSDTSANWQLV